jgi:hypothetical protein
MRGNRFLRGLKFLFFAVLFVAAAGFVVMHLWNWLLPGLFGWPVISFWKAIGVLVLSKILFGGFRGPGRHKYWRRHMIERWEQMSPEEREKFRERMGGRCGPFAPPVVERKA